MNSLMKHLNNARLPLCAALEMSGFTQSNPLLLCFVHSAKEEVTSPLFAHEHIGSPT